MPLLISDLASSKKPLRCSFISNFRNGLMLFVLIFFGSGIQRQPWPAKKERQTQSQDAKLKSPAPEPAWLKKWPVTKFVSRLQYFRQKRWLHQIRPGCGQRQVWLRLLLRAKQAEALR